MSRIFKKRNIGDKITFNSFECDNKEIIFKAPYQINVTKDNHGFYADDDFLDIHCFGKNLDELKEDIIIELQEIYHGYVNFDINKLSIKGKELRNKFKAMFTE